MSAPFLLSCRLAESAWRHWLEEKLEWDSTNDFYPRRLLIYSLVVDALIPFITSHKYQFGCDPKRIANIIARALYFGEVRNEEVNTDYVEEDYNHYLFKLDDDTWDSFWSQWGVWKDIDSEHIHERELVRLCVWTLLDLEHSPESRMVEELMGLWEDEDGEEGGGKQKKKREQGDADPYLQDAAAGFFMPT